VQEDKGHVVLTDLDSTNGTRVNGETVQLRLLRPGDRVSIGRSTLIFGSLEEIAASVQAESIRARANGGQAEAPAADVDVKAGFKTNVSDDDADFMLESEGGGNIFERPAPALPTDLSPAQAAQLSEAIDFLHRALADATDPILIPDNA